MGIGAPELLAEPVAHAPERRWRRRPFLRATIILAAVLAPAAVAAGVAIGFTRLVPLPGDLVGIVVWSVIFTVAVIVAWILSAELLRRTLPLATLLDMTLAFPDSAPSRFAILRRNVNRRHLDSELRRLRERSDPDSAPRAQLILELAVALSIHDNRTRGHSERVRLYTDLIAQELHLAQRDADRLRWAALLHDIGKLAVAPAILNKTDLPDDEERVSLRNHPIEGYRLIAPLHRWLGPWAATVRDHHERFDGSGYPSGLSGRAISLGGRIVAVADSYEAMTAGRPYRKPLSVKAAREELVRRSGTHFDPEVVRAFLAVSLGRLWPVVGISALLAEMPFLASASGRFSQLSLRTVSGFAAAGTTVTLVVAGLAGPTAGVFVHGPSSKSIVASTQTNNPGTSPAPTTPPASPAVQAPAPAVTSGAPAGPTTQATSSTTPPTTGAPPPSSGPPPTGGQSLYPAGIGKHGVLPAGIAKQTNPFAQWRLHH
ncbi:MAG TPA: HD-GYP domain-containing protein [Candidatus Dormibacteraeota bacterium]|nr:HD-GYP domain-containing protein [Candidatus Dormibacteraeota bacterium]